MLWILASAAIALLCYEVPTLITAVLQPLWSDPNALQTDFHYYYEAARRFSSDDTMLYVPTDDVIAGFAYPPPAIVPFMWLQRLPLGGALLLFTIASYAALLVAVRMWLSYLEKQGVVADTRTKIAVVLIALAAGPTYMNAVFGQVNAFVLACSVAFVSFAPLLPLAAGVALALGTLLKVYPIGLVTIGAWDGRTRRAVVWTMVAAAVIAVVTLPLIPPAAYRVFLFDVLPARIDKTAIHISNQSLVAFIERFRYPSAQFLNWTGEQAVTVSGLVRVLNLGFAAAVVAALAKRSGDGPRARAMIAATLIALIAVVAPLGWGHTYVMALPLVMLQLASLRDARPIAASTIFCCVAAMMIPAGRRLAVVETAPDWLLNMMYSRYLLATLVLAAIPAAPIGRTTESRSVTSA